MTLRAVVKLEDFLDYHGHSYAEALDKFSILQSFHNYRQEKNDSNVYAGVSHLIAFYDELSSGNRPESVELAFIEHY